MKAIYLQTLTFLFALTFTTVLSAQRDIKGSLAPHTELPKLEKVMVIGDEKGVIKAPDAESFGQHISDTEATNRSVSDGKISRREQAVIDRAKRMPQDQ